MSFTLSDLSVLAYANNFTLWHYKTEDSAVTGANYFGLAADMMNEGDLIIANIDTDGSPSTQFYIVTNAASGNVSVALYA